MSNQRGMPAGGSISLLGDLMFRAPVAAARWEAGSFHDVVAELGRGDLTVANLELPLSRRGNPVPKWANLRAEPELIDDVRRMGIDAVSLANNHMLDFGSDALLDTLDACDAAAVARCGAGHDLDEALRPIMLSVGELRVALIGVACTVPLEAEARPGKPGIAPLRIHVSFELEIGQQAEQPGSMPPVHTWADASDLERVTSEIARVRADADLVIVSIHWGVPGYWLSPCFNQILAEYQTPVGHALIDAGADVIHGHHSHSLHPIEVYRGKPIIYSLGNFLFDWVLEFMEPESLIARLHVAGGDWSLELIPLLVDETTGFPQLATGAEAQKVLTLLEDLSRPFGTKIRIDGERAVIVLK